VGRDRDLAELDALLDHARLVTLTGPSGIGKTSVAVEVARKRAAQTPDGAWLVTLDSVSDPTLVLAEVARTLGLFDGAAHPAVEALPGFVAQRSMLLVLDNFEHLLDAAGDVATLVRASPASRFIVTSRAALRLQGEHDYAMSPLALGAPGSPADPGDDPAARLFVDRARAVRSGWEPGRDEALVVADVCDLLDRLPLGIELAAARMAVLPVSAIRDRLQAHLPLPGAGPRDAPARQRTLEGAIGWSHDLLEPADQRILHELAVFEGGFDVAQAERVAIDGTMPYDGERGERGGRMGTDVLDRLVALAEQSLISRQAAQTGLGRNLAGTDARFGMLKTVQGFALARLATEGRESEVRRRHAVAFLDVAQEASRHMPASGQAAWLDRLTLDHANLRAALQWSVETGEVAIALALVGAMWRFWQLDGRLVEGRGWADAALTMPGAAAPTPERLAAITAAGGLAYWQGDRAASNDLYREQLTLSEELGDAAATADAWLNLAASSFVRGDPTEAIHCGEEARRLFVELGDERGVNRIQWGLANMALDTLGPETALAQLLSVRDRAVELGDAPYAAITAGSLGWVSFMTGDPLGARRWTIRAMVEMYGLRDLASTTISLPACALVALDAGKPIEAAELMGAFEGLSERYGVRPPLGLAEMIGRQEPTGHIRELLTPDVLAASMERGRRMSVDEAVELVVSLGDASPTT